MCDIKKKKVILAAAFAGLSVGAFGQGTVAFNTFQVTPKVYTNDFAGHSGLATQKSFTVALYWASASGAALSPIFTAQAATAADGNFFFSGVTTPNATAPGSTAVFQVYGWTGSAPNLNAALVSLASIAASSPFLNITGGGTVTPPALTGWTGNLVFTPIDGPEPATVAICSLGATALFLFRRHK